MADVTLPQLGETVTEGTITQWFKNVGDTVTADEPLFEVSTDKVDTEVPSPVSGVLTEIRVPEGDTVDVGTVIAVVGDSSDAPGGSPAPAEPAPAASAPAAEAPAAEPTPPAPEPSVAAGSPVAAATPPPLPPATPAPAAAPTPAVAPTAAAGDNRLLSPVVRRLVNEHGLDPDAITGTGPGGRITRDDVLDHIDATGATPQTAAATPAAASAPSAPPAPPVASAPAASAPAPGTAPPAPVRTASPAPAVGERDSLVPLSKIRTLTGNHMVMSKATSPHAFSVVEVDFANVDVVRNAVKSEWKATHGFSLTYLPFISRAIIDGLGEFPHLNASVGERDLIVHNFIDLGIAVDLDYEGLLAPVIRDAETKRLAALATEISDLANRARTRKLSPDEISGGTFTISNNGSAGSVLTMPIINQPQVAIISTDAIVRKPVVTVGPDGGEAIAIHPVGNLAMSWDHRAFDGAYAAGFLKRVKEILETKDWSTEL
jgi:pyruvate dehydrogenase E2 component (dihydrolipoamide acetyltransferase)